MIKKAGMDFKDFPKFIRQLAEESFRVANNDWPHSSNVSFQKFGNGAGFLLYDPIDIVNYIFLQYRKVDKASAALICAYWLGLDPFVMSIFMDVGVRQH